MNVHSLKSHKKQLRQELRLKRQQLTKDLLLKSEAGLLDQYGKFTAGKTFGRIAIYLQNDNELGTGTLIEYLFQSGCELYLPKISDDANELMQFVHYEQTTKMTNNRFGIPEPESGKVISVEQLDLIFLPLTAFDLQGNRLGMGGGFYDRTLKNISDNKPILAGLAYDFQQLSACPVEPFDQPIHYILTPSRVIEF